MKRFDVVAIKTLQPGDRFYFAGKGKTIYQVEMKQLGMFTKAVSYVVVTNTVTKVDKKRKPGVMCVFLRNVKDEG